MSYFTGVMRKIGAFIWYQKLHFDGWIQKWSGHSSLTVWTCIYFLPSQSYLQSIQGHLSPELQRIASITHIPPEPDIPAIPAHQNFDQTTTLLDYHHDSDPQPNMTTTSTLTSLDQHQQNAQQYTKLPETPDQIITDVWWVVDEVVCVYISKVGYIAILYRYCVVSLWRRICPYRVHTELMNMVKLSHRRDPEIRSSAFALDKGPARILSSWTRRDLSIDLESERASYTLYLVASPAHDLPLMDY